MGRIARCLHRLHNRGEKAFIAYVCAGDPNLKQTENIVLALESVGVDIIELGIPFSDPLADGPVIQRASERALENKVSTRDVLAFVERLRTLTDIPIILFTYYNPIMQFGLEQFASTCKANGVDGALVLDLPPEESGGYLSLMRLAERDTPYLLAPTSTDARIKTICEVSTGFVYSVSREGVTGMQTDVADTLEGAVAHIRTMTALPIAVGFGISTPEQSAQVATVADAVVVGSAIVDVIGTVGDVPALPGRVADFVRSLVEGAKGFDPVVTRR